MRRIMFPTSHKTLLYGQFDQIKRMSCEQHVAYMEEKRTVYKVWEGEHAGKRAVGRTRHRWKHNIKTSVE
jgi:hypothetical protein